jgi:hypothetical protein
MAPDEEDEDAEASHTQNQLRALGASDAYMGIQTTSDAMELERCEIKCADEEAIVRPLLCELMAQSMLY